MLKTGMYVRCSIDVEDPNEPRDFISGKIIEINEFAEKATVKFYDLLGLKNYYKVPETLDFPLSKLGHCRISNGFRIFKGFFNHLLDFVFFRIIGHIRSSNFFNFLQNLRV